MSRGLLRAAPDRKDAAVRLAALLLAAVTAAVLLAPTLPVPPADAGPPATAASPLEQRLVTQVNRERARHGCRALRHRAALQATARGHSALMARHRRLAHQLPGEAALGTRLADAGYRGARRMGEVIAAGPMSAKRVLRMWLQSPPHRRLLLDCRFRQLGAGVVEGGPGQRWWTVDLVR